MNEEKLLDAIGEISTELVEEADRRRNAPREIKLPRPRMFAAVACFIIALSLALVTARFVMNGMDVLHYDGVEAEGNETVPMNVSTPPAGEEALGSNETVMTDGSSTVVSEGSDETVSESAQVEIDNNTPDVADLPKTPQAEKVGDTEIILYSTKSLPSSPQKIESYALGYKNGTYSGKNIEYTDNAYIRMDKNGGIAVGFVIYQDSLDYTAGLMELLDGCVTVDYEGNTHESHHRANECITAAVNGVPVRISEVRLGKGNGHMDYHFTLTSADGEPLLFTELSDLIIDIVRPDSDTHHTEPHHTYNSTVSDNDDIVSEPISIPRLQFDDSFAIPEESFGYFNFGNRTYTLWQEIPSDMGIGQELFKVTNTLNKKPYDFYENYGGNMNASVCSIAGFNTDFALAANVNGKYYICICLNDIKLYSARDLFCSRFGLDRLYSRAAYELVGDPSTIVFTEKEMSSEVYQDFMTALFDSEFVERSKLLMTRLATVHFMTDDGIKLSLSLYEGGYVTLGNVNDFANMMLDVDKAAFDAFTASLDKRTFDADEFAGFVTSSDRELMFVAKPLASSVTENYIYFFKDENSLLPLIYYTVDRGNTVKTIEYGTDIAAEYDISRMGNIHTAVGDGYELGFFIELILSDGSTVYASFNNYANANMYEWTRFNFIGCTHDIISHHTEPHHPIHH